VLCRAVCQVIHARRLPEANLVLPNIISAACDSQPALSCGCQTCSNLSRFLCVLQCAQVE